MRTEARNPRASGLSSLSTRALLELINDEDATVAAAVPRALPAIERAVEAVVAALAHGGHVIYVGAGTSGRLGALDASEIPPTFGAEPELFHAVIAGGDSALRRSVEGAEDDREAGRREVGAVLRPHDVIVGISASGRAPYVLGGLDAATGIASASIGITCNESSDLAAAAEIPIVLETGPEIIAGSSRLKAGTATKLVLNMLSTAAMVRSGRTRDDLMIDMRPTNMKLRERAVRMVGAERGVSEDEARALLEASHWSVREALDLRRDDVGRSERA